MRSSCITLVLLCAACAGPRISEDVLDVARATVPGGEFHIEFGPDGRVIEAGGEVPLDALPAKVRASLDASYPGGHTLSAARVVVDGQRLWSVAKRIDGRDFEFLVRADGKVLGGEESLARTFWPAAVLAAAHDAVPGAKLERVERVWGVEARDGEHYHVKFVDRGESVRVGVTAEGQVVRVVRRMAGQVRVPR